MAKSLRSKWKRKMKAIKRVRYADKELKQLKTILEKAEKKDIIMSDTCTVTTKDTLTTKGKQATNGDLPDKMDLDKTASDFHPQRLTNKHGNYPVWMNQRAIKKHKARFGFRKNGKTKRK